MPHAEYISLLWKKLNGRLLLAEYMIRVKKVFSEGWACSEGSEAFVSRCPRSPPARNLEEQGMKGDVCCGAGRGCSNTAGPWAASGLPS